MSTINRYWSGINYSIHNIRMQSLIRVRFASQQPPVAARTLVPRQLASESNHIHDVFANERVARIISLGVGVTYSDRLMHLLLHYGSNDHCSFETAKTMFHHQLLFEPVMRTIITYLCEYCTHRHLTRDENVMGVVCAIVMRDVDHLCMFGSHLKALTNLRLICEFADGPTFDFFKHRMKMMHSTHNMLVLYTTTRCSMTTGAIRSMLCRLPSRTWNSLLQSDPLFTIHCLRYFPFTLRVAIARMSFFAKNMDSSVCLGDNTTVIKVSDVCVALSRWIAVKPARRMLVSVSSHSRSRKMWMAAVLLSRLNRELATISSRLYSCPNMQYAARIIVLCIIAVVAEDVAYIEWNEHKFAQLEVNWCCDIKGNSVSVQIPRVHITAEQYSRVVEKVNSCGVLVIETALLSPLMFNVVGCSSDDAHLLELVAPLNYGLFKRCICS